MATIGEISGLRPKSQCDRKIPYPNMECANAAIDSLRSSAKCVDGHLLHAYRCPLDKSHYHVGRGIDRSQHGKGEEAKGRATQREARDDA